MIAYLPEQYVAPDFAGKVLGEGSGKSKKYAEQHAAHEALTRLKGK